MTKPKISLSVKSGDKVQKIADDINNLSPEAREIATGIIDTLAAADDRIDVFYWANQTVSVIEDLDAQLFMISKNNVVYSVSYHVDLARQLRPLFIDDMLEAVFSGAETGMAVREIHTTDGEDNVLDFAPIESVPVAAEIVSMITENAAEIVQFSHDEHDISRMKAVVALFTPKVADENGTTGPFFIFKHLQKSNVITGSRSWTLDQNGLSPNPSQATIRVTPDNQVLILDGQIFAFNVSKFSKIFAYDAKQEVKVNGKIAEIEKYFKLSFPEGVTLKGLCDANPQLAAKLLRSDPASVDQEKMVETADTFGLALMQDDAGAFIIMDKRDVNMFANLLNDDYVDSGQTGIHYLAEKKKEVSAAVDAQVNLGL